MDKYEELGGLRVELDELVGLRPEEDGEPWRFLYKLTIHNASDETVTIKGRKWIVRDTRGETLVVEGDGVVGQHPCLEPGEQFSYNSSHAIHASATASGSLLGITGGGRVVVTRLPTFAMEVD